MRCDRLNVFDLDGTLIKVNSFREISKNLMVFLLKSGRLLCFCRLLGWYLVRKVGLLSHLRFKQRVVSIFEGCLSESEKRDLVSAAFEQSVNDDVFDLMLGADDCVISTAAPFAFVSRMSFQRDVSVICSLMPDGELPDRTNFGPGKVANLKARFGEDTCVLNCYTDCDDDRALMDFSVNAFMCKNGLPKKVK